MDAEGSQGDDRADDRANDRADDRADDFAAAVTAVTNAFGDPTRRDIYLFCRAGDRGVTAAEVAGRFDLHPNVARHHLEKLAAGGYLDVHVERSERGGAGRPSKRYRVTAKDAAVPAPPRRDDLLVALINRLLAVVPTDQAAAVAEEVGMEYGHMLARQMSPGDGQRSFRAALQAVADALTAHGFAAHAEARGASLAIVSEHCPFGATALAHPVVCAVDRGVVKGMLESLYGDTRPALEACRTRGDEVCVTLV